MWSILYKFYDEYSCILLQNATLPWSGMLVNFTELHTSGFGHRAGWLAVKNCSKSAWNDKYEEINVTGKQHFKVKTSLATLQTKFFKNKKIK